MSVDKRIIAGVAAGVFVASVAALQVFTERVPAGYRGVIVNLYGSDKGVSDQSVGVGRYLLGFNKELYLFPTFLQNYSWTDSQSILMQTSEGLQISTDAGITYRINPDNVVKVFTKYRLGIKEITNTFLHNMVRDAMNAVSSKMSIEQIYGADKDKFIKRVNDIVKKEAAINGIEVDKIYLIGSLRLPDSVVYSINAKIEATQNALKVENEVQTSKAEAQKQIVQAKAAAEREIIEAEANAKRIMLNAESQAKANRILAESLTPEFVKYQTVLKWNGALPLYSGAGTPFINLKDK